MSILSYQQNEEARQWLDDLRAGNWPRGRMVAARQARVLESIVSESDEAHKAAEERGRLLAHGGGAY